MKILVTGAAGFLGQTVVSEAVLAGHEVRAWIKNPRANSSELSRDADAIAGDLRDASIQSLAVNGMEAIIHCAAVTSTGRTDPELSQAVNVDAFRSLYSAFKKAGGRRWIQISSMSAHPGSTSAYGRTKLAGDEILRASTPPPDWTIFRPSLIYGPGEQGLVAKTLKLLEKIPVLPLIGSGRELIRPIYVSDVARAALFCLANPKTYQKTYMLGGSDEVELRDFMQRLAKCRGLTRPPLPIPIPAAYLLARALSMATPQPPLSIDNVLGVKEAQRVDIRSAQADFGFRPLSLEEGLSRTFAGSAQKP